MQTYKKTLQWAVNGALVGFLISWIDMMVEWRSVMFAEWVGAGIVYNLAHFFGSAAGAGTIGLIAGAVRDARAARRGILMEVAPRDGADRKAFLERLGMVGRLGLVLYWIGTGIGVFCALSAIAAIIFGPTNDRWFFAFLLAFIGTGSFGIGAGCRFILTGPTIRSNVLFLAPHFSWKPVLTTVVLAATVGIGRAAYDTYRDPLPGLWGNTRVQFVKGAFANCERTQVAHPENKMVNRGTIRTYCQCFADRLADRVSLSELKRMRHLSADQQRSVMLTQHDTDINDVSGACAAAAMNLSSRRGISR